MKLTDSKIKRAQKLVDTLKSNNYHITSIDFQIDRIVVTARYSNQHHHLDISYTIYYDKKIVETVYVSVFSTTYGTKLRATFYNCEFNDIFVTTCKAKTYLKHLISLETHI